eukprot:1359202-Rhodomonas_salina.3
MRRVPRRTVKDHRSAAELSIQQEMIQGGRVGLAVDAAPVRWPNRTEERERWTRDNGVENLVHSCSHGGIRVSPPLVGAGGVKVSTCHPGFGLRANTLYVRGHSIPQDRLTPRAR